MKLYFKLPSHSYLCKYAIRIEEKLAKKEENLKLFYCHHNAASKSVRVPDASALRSSTWASWVALDAHLHGSFYIILSWIIFMFVNCVFFTALMSIWSYGTLALSDSCRCHESCTYEVVSMYCTQKANPLAWHSRSRQSISQTQKRYSLHSLCWLARPFREVDKT